MTHYLTVEYSVDYIRTEGHSPKKGVADPATPLYQILKIECK